MYIGVKFCVCVLKCLQHLKSSHLLISPSLSIEVVDHVRRPPVS